MDGPDREAVEKCDGSESNSVAIAKKLIHGKMLIGIQDGRFFVGTFYCMDKQGNIILQDAVEYLRWSIVASVSSSSPLFRISSLCSL